MKHRRTPLSREVVAMSRSRDDAYRAAYRPDGELYVYDQFCDNCRFYCDWDDEEHNGCKNYDRPDYEQYPQSNWCCDWKSKRGRCR